MHRHCDSLPVHVAEPQMAAALTDLDETCASQTHEVLYVVGAV